MESGKCVRSASVDLWAAANMEVGHFVLPSPLVHDDEVSTAQIGQELILMTMPSQGCSTNPDEMSNLGRLAIRHLSRTGHPHLQSVQARMDIQGKVGAVGVLFIVNSSLSSTLLLGDSAATTTMGGNGKAPCRVLFKTDEESTGP